MGCRSKKEKSDLTRVVRQGSYVTIDPTGAAPGRGAYVCPGDDCLRRALDKGALARALKVKQELVGRLGAGGEHHA